MSQSLFGSMCVILHQVRWHGRGVGGAGLLKMPTAKPWDRVSSWCLGGCSSCHIAPEIAGWLRASETNSILQLSSKLETPETRRKGNGSSTLLCWSPSAPFPGDSCSWHSQKQPRGQVPSWGITQPPAGPKSSSSPAASQIPCQSSAATKKQVQSIYRCLHLANLFEGF